MLPIIEGSPGIVHNYAFQFLCSLNATSGCEVTCLETAETFVKEQGYGLQACICSCLT